MTWRLKYGAGLEGHRDIMWRQDAFVLTAERWLISLFIYRMSEYAHVRSPPSSKYSPNGLARVILDRQWQGINSPATIPIRLSVPSPRIKPVQK
jgi:hypothetical protein